MRIRVVYFVAGLNTAIPAALFIPQRRLPARPIGARCLF
jgi:hypothetical protein